MKKYLFVLPLLLILAGSAFGQNSPYYEHLTEPGGTAAPYPLVTVCVAGTTLVTQPCPTKATIYSDAGGTAQVNPFRGDARGNFQFFAPSGDYVISIGAPFSPGYSKKITIAGAGSDCTATVRGLVPAPPNDANQVLLGTCVFGPLPGPLGALTIFATNYGLKHDGLGCYGLSSTISVVNGNTTVTCSSASFTNADVGKYLFITTGCCGTIHNYNGVLLYKGSIASVTNGTTVVLSGTPPSGSCTTTCIMIWGTLDDAALSAAEAAYAATQPCGALALPTGMILVKEPHFNLTFTASCKGVTFTQDYAGTIYGQGPASTMLIPVPDYDWAACPPSIAPYSLGNVCNFNVISPTILNLGFNGGGYGNTGNHTGTNFIALIQGAQTFQLACSMFGGSDAGLTGIILAGGSRMMYTIADGCGFSDFVSSAHPIAGTNEAFNYCYYCFGADSIGPALSVEGGVFEDFGGEWGPIGNASGTINSNNAQVLVALGGQYFSYGATNFVLDASQKSLTNNVALYVDDTGTAWLDGGAWDGNTECVATCYGLYMGGPTSKVYAHNTSFYGSGFAIVNRGGNGGAAGGFFDLGGNTVGPNGYVPNGSFPGVAYGDLSVTGAPQVIGNIVASTCGTSSNGTLIAGSTAKHGRFTVTFAGAPGSTCTQTVTFPTTNAAFWGVPFCTATAVGGTNAAPTSIVNGATSATSFAFTINGTFVNGNTEILDYDCKIP